MGRDLDKGGKEQKRMTVVFDKPFKFDSVSFPFSQLNGLNGEYKRVETVFIDGSQFPELKHGQYAVHNGKCYYEAHMPNVSHSGLKGCEFYRKNSAGDWVSD